MHKGDESGFTLIELMVVVGIVSLLAAVAIPTFSKYIRKAKSTEARTSLKQIIDGATAYYYDEQTATKSIGSIARQFPSGGTCLLYTSPSPRDATLSRMPSSA